MAWLSRERPELVPAYEQLYRRGAYAPAAYGDRLSARLKPMLARHGLDRSARGQARGLDENSSARPADPERPSAEQLKLM